jgi:hypothetical protein
MPLAIRLDTNLPSMQRIQTTIRTGNTPKMVTYELISLLLYLVEKTPAIVEAYYEESSGHFAESR